MEIDQNAGSVQKSMKTESKEAAGARYNGNKILRFTAKFASPKPEDVLRRSAAAKLLALAISILKKREKITTNLSSVARR